MNTLIFLRDAFAGRKLATAGFLWLCLIVVAAIIAPLVAPFDPLEIDPVGRLTEPGWPNLFGTDHFGRDTFSRAIYGARMTVIIAVWAASSSLLLRVARLIGMLSAYFHPPWAFLDAGSRRT